MKSWRFYKKPESKDLTSQSYELYACTANKVLAKRFMKERNMELFIIRSTTSDLDTYAQFANENRDSLLDLHDLVTKKLGKDGFYYHTEMEVLCTEYEYQTCSESNTQIYQYTDDFWAGCPYYKIFCDELINALRTIQYVENYKIFNMSAVIDPDDDDYSAPDSWVDELAVFVRTFKNTFK